MSRLADAISGHASVSVVPRRTFQSPSVNVVPTGNGARAVPVVGGAGGVAVGGGVGVVAGPATTRTLRVGVATARRILPATRLRGAYTRYRAVPAVAGTAVVKANLPRRVDFFAARLTHSPVLYRCSTTRRAASGGSFPASLTVARGSTCVAEVVNAPAWVGAVEPAQAEEGVAMADRPTTSATAAVRRATRNRYNAKLQSSEMSELSDTLDSVVTRRWQLSQLSKPTPRMSRTALLPGA